MGVPEANAGDFPNAVALVLNIEGMAGAVSLDVHRDRVDFTVGPKIGAPRTWSIPIEGPRA